MKTPVACRLHTGRSVTATVWDFMSKTRLVVNSNRETLTRQQDPLITNVVSPPVLIFPVVHATHILPWTHIKQYRNATLHRSACETPQYVKNGVVSLGNYYLYLIRKVSDTIPFVRNDASVTLNLLYIDWCYSYTGLCRPLSPTET